MHFPLFVDLTDKPCLVVGAGPVAARKAGLLAGFGARVTVVSPDADGEGNASVPAKAIARPFQPGDLADQSLVVAATDDAALNARIASLCRERRIPVNVVDDPAQCTFIFPSVARKGPIVAAVSTGGACPVAARLLRERVEGLLTDGLCATVARLGARREALKREMPDLAVRKAWMRKELESC